MAIRKEVYISEDGEEFPTEEEAIAHETRIRVKEEKRIRKEARDEKKANNLRLTLSSIRDLPRELEKIFYSTYKVKVTFNEFSLRFTNVSCSHNAPIGGKTNWGGQEKDIPSSYPGFSGWIKGKSSDSNFSITDAIDGQERRFSRKFKYKNPIRGIHTGCFNGGEFFSGELYLFLSDFPILYEKYHEAVALKGKVKDMETRNGELRYKMNLEAQELYAVKECDNHIAEINNEISELTSRRDLALTLRKTAIDRHVDSATYEELPKKDKERLKKLIREGF